MQKAFSPQVLGAQIRRLAQTRGWSQEGLALQLEVAPTTIRRWMSGKTVPDLHNVCFLAELFEVSVEELIFGKATRASEPPTIYYGMCQVLSRISPTFQGPSRSCNQYECDQGQTD